MLLLIVSFGTCFLTIAATARLLTHISRAAFLMLNNVMSLRYSCSTNTTIDTHDGKDTFIRILGVGQTKRDRGASDPSH